MPIADLLRERIGLDPASLGADAIASAVRQRMQAVECGRVEAYERQVQSSEREFEELLGVVLVPETWFFRGCAAFELLRHFVANEWRPANPLGTLRVLSAPCCTGEEPYSIAMTLLHAGLPPTAFKVDGVDISREFIAKARRAEYRAHAFRNEGQEFARPYVIHAGDKIHLQPEAVASVEFAAANLLDSGALQERGRYSVVFCRNLLIYLHTRAREQVLALVDRLLEPGGLLFAGHAELLQRPGYRPMTPLGAFAYRRTDKQAPLDGVDLQTKASTPLGRPSRPPSHVYPPRLSPAGPARKSQRGIVVPPLRSEAAAGEESLARARELANAGRLVEAASLCERRLSADGPCARTYCLLGEVCAAAGDLARAEDCLNKALYLDSGLVEALVHLSLLAHKRGDAHAAAHFRQRAARLSRRAPKPRLSKR